MLRSFSNACFGLALGTCLLMRLFGARDEWVLFVAICVALTAILTNLMLIRYMGFAGVAGLSLIYQDVASVSTPATGLIILTAILLVGGIILALCADLGRAVHRESGEKTSS